MALNPPLLPGGLPAGIAGEFFCLERSGIELSVDTQSRELGKQVLAKCRLFMTTLRMCVVCTTANSSGLQSFDIPMQGISGESFEQPWFGANYLKLAVAPVLGRGLTSPAQVKITFIEGGCGLFLRVFFALMAKYKDADAAARAAFLAPPSMQAWVSQTQTAYVDRELAFPALALLLYAAAHHAHPPRTCRYRHFQKTKTKKTRICSKRPKQTLYHAARSPPRTGRERRTAPRKRRTTPARALAALLPPAFWWKWRLRICANTRD
jgi:hypothetical protein